MTLVRANANLAGIAVREERDVDVDHPLWANRVRNGLVTITGPLDQPDPPVDPDGETGAADEAVRLVHQANDLDWRVGSLNVDDTVALIHEGWTVEEVAAAERRGKARTTVLRALERWSEG